MATISDVVKFIVMQRRLLGPAVKGRQQSFVTCATNALGPSEIFC